MANYQTIPVAQPKRSKQKNTVFSVGTSDFGRLQPVGTFEVVPGDKISLDMRSFVRAAPPSAPVYGRIKIHTDAFFVPYRILWSSWDEYIAGNTDSTPPYTTISKLMQDVKINGVNGGSDVYADEQEFHVAQDAERVLCGLKYSKQLFYAKDLNETYLGKRISTLPIRAYKKIWWDYYRDSVNIPETTKSTYIAAAGGSTYSSSVDKITNNPEVMYRCYGKDYLTTALPTANGGTTDSFKQYGSTAYGYATSVENTLPHIYDGNNTYSPSGTGQLLNVPIQAIRAANALQRYMEKNNIVGTRLISRLLARFGVTPSAERLQRAEYLGSHIFQMKVSDIDSTESTDLLSEAANETIYNAFGSSESFANIRGQASGKITGGQDGMTFNYNATEFGIIIIIQSIMPDESYYQGLDRSLVRGLSTPNSDRFDYFTPEFENLGYQPVLASDVFIPDDDANPSLKNVYDANKVFGYQPRYHDYKFMRHVLFGDFTSNVFSTGLDAYHLFRDLSFLQQRDDQQEMVVSESFNQLGIDERINYDRIFQIPITQVQMRIGTQSSNTLQTKPATIDHFQLFNRIEYSAMRKMDGDDMPELVAGENDNEGGHISVPAGGIRM
jgi:hypothetical protein